MENIYHLIQPNYYFRMGSFSYTARLPRAEDLDEDLDFTTTTREELLDRCEDELEDLPTPFDRKFSKTFPQHT